MDKKNMKFSVLISVYHKEKPEYLKEAIESIISQSLKPSEVVLIKDGPLTKELDNVINKYVSEYQNLFKIIAFEENKGLGIALQEGVLNCSYDIIARMDTDDIAHPQRFEEQINFLKENPEVSIIGSFISEFEENPENIYAQRKLPISHDEIYKFAKWRNPLNHMTVMYKKQAVIEAGNYQNLLYFEDYYLWGRMLNKGFKFANIPKNLVNARAGMSMLTRRSGEIIIRQEAKLFKEFYKMGFINIFELTRNVILKTLLRIIPNWFRAFIYNNFLRKGN